MPRKMNDQQRQALLRARKLHRQGKSWPQVAEILARGGIVTGKGAPYSAGALQVTCSRLETSPPQEAGDQAERRERADTKRKHTRSRAKVDKGKSLSRDKDDKITRKDLEAVMQRVESLIDEKIQAALGVPHAVAPVSRGDDPPLPPKTGKTFHGEKKDLRARIDSNLMTLLDADCGTHYNGNMSRCLDAILWRYYGNPRLSFEKTEER